MPSIAWHKLFILCFILLGLRSSGHTLLLRPTSVFPPLLCPSLCILPYWPVLSLSLDYHLQYTRSPRSCDQSIYHSRPSFVSLPPSLNLNPYPSNVTHCLPLNNTWWLTNAWTHHPTRTHIYPSSTKLNDGHIHSSSSTRTYLPIHRSIVYPLSFIYY